MNTTSNRLCKNTYTKGPPEKSVGSDANLMPYLCAYCSLKQHEPTRVE